MWLVLCVALLVIVDGRAVIGNVRVGRGNSYSSNSRVVINGVEINTDGDLINGVFVQNKPEIRMDDVLLRGSRMIIDGGRIDFNGVHLSTDDEIVVEGTSMNMRRSHVKAKGGRIHVKGTSLTFEGTTFETGGGILEIRGTSERFDETTMLTSGGAINIEGTGMTLSHAEIRTDGGRFHLEGTSVTFRGGRVCTNRTCTGDGTFAIPEADLPGVACEGFLSLKNDMLMCRGPGAWLPPLSFRMMESVCERCVRTVDGICRIWNGHCRFKVEYD